VWSRVLGEKIMTNNEMHKMFLEAFDFSKFIGEDVRFAEAVNQGGEWASALVDLEAITDTRFVENLVRL
jgi:hypothetical protein